MPGRILIVDDEQAVRYFVARGLTRAGWQVDEANSGETALAILERHSYDVMLLDLRMLGMDGLTVMRQVKQRWPETRIIILTAYATLDSAIEAVRQGAFDYLNKPCDVSEVIACANRALSKKEEQDRQRRLLNQAETKLMVEAAPPPTSPAVVRSGPLSIELGARRVFLAGQPIWLTPTEYNLLEILAKSIGQPISLDKLVQEGLGYGPNDPQLQETLRVHISHLRQKLGPGYILTVRGGYVLASMPTIPS
ncbi:MAG: response regulator transcription factor [Anaerolineales bacterium]|nr:response regulator transcription factor [Anaerolineales bacterium]